MTIVATSSAGHALDSGVPRYQAAADAVHLAAASAWIGGLAALALTGSGARRFSRIALAAVATIAATGALRAVSELSAVDQLWSTAYGRALIAKTAIFAGLVSLGVRSRRRVSGDRERAASHRRRRARARGSSRRRRRRPDRGRAGS